jgi:GxxExxY protein
MRCPDQNIFKNSGLYLQMADTIRDISQSVWSALGPGYSERVYHNAFEVALRKRGVPYETERVLPVNYEGTFVGFMRADIVIDNKIIVELKSAARLTPAFRTQVQKYMEITGCDQGYLINFPVDSSIVEIESFGKP